jgi:WD40 repeat protein
MSQRLDSEQELITCDAYGRLLFWDCDVRDAVQALEGASRSALHTVTVSPSGRYMAFAGEDMYVKVLDLVTSRVVSHGLGHGAAVRTVQWAPDEKQIVSGGDDCALCVWNFFEAF